MKLQKLYSYTRKALDDYHMIEANDKIAIGISGGKDSLALLYSLAGLRKFYPIPFSIIAITIDLGFGNTNYEPIADLCNSLDVEYHVIQTQIKDILELNMKDKTYCSLCAKLRKGALNSEIKKLGCNKVAYAHHMDDIIETMFLSLLYEGKFYSFSPVTYLDKSDITVIRPLMYIPECEIIGFKNKYELPCTKNPCPYDGFTKREYVKQLVKKIHQDTPGAKQRIFHAIINGNIEGWPKL